MASQLPLDLPHTVSLSRDDLIVSASNAAAIEAIESWPKWQHNVLLIVGPEGSGKSHLARVWAEQAAASVPTQDDALEIAARNEFRVLLDDIDRSPMPDALLFALVNAARLGRGWVLATARQRPADMGELLPDLRSRLSAATSTMLAPPDDALFTGMLVKLFADRQLLLDAATLRYLTERIERSASAAQEIVAALDRTALSQKRRITKSLVRQVLDSENDSSASMS